MKSKIITQADLDATELQLIPVQIELAFYDNSISSYIPITSYVHAKMCDIGLYRYIYGEVNESSFIMKYANNYSGNYFWGEPGNNREIPISKLLSADESLSVIITDVYYPNPNNAYDPITSVGLRGLASLYVDAGPGPYSQVVHLDHTSYWITNNPNVNNRISLPNLKSKFNFEYGKCAIYIKIFRTDLMT